MHGTTALKEKRSVTLMTNKLARHSDRKIQGDIISVFAPFPINSSKSAYIQTFCIQQGLNASVKRTIKNRLAKKKFFMGYELLLFMYLISKQEKICQHQNIYHYVPNQQIHGRRTLAKMVNKHKKDREKNKNVTTKGYLDT